jgi:Cu/Zn superoxide dismutase
MQKLAITFTTLAFLGSVAACNRDYTTTRDNTDAGDRTVSERTADEGRRLAAEDRDDERLAERAPAAGPAPAQVATAQLKPTEGGDARGTASFASTADGVRVTIDMTGLEPGQHDILVHESNDCTKAAEDGSMDTTGAKSIEADSLGRARTEFVDNRLALEGQTSIVGRTVVIQEQDNGLGAEPEDMDADVACGVIVAGRP